MLAGFVCDEDFFVVFFFLTGFVERVARFAVAAFDFVRLRLLLFFLEGIPAVYHRD